MSSHEDTCLIKKLRTCLCDLLESDVDDYELRKWLTARNFDVHKAEKMYRESYSYKKKMNTEGLFWNYKMPEVLAKYFPGGLLGFDKEGSPVVIELFGKYDMEGLMRSCTRSDLERLKLFQCESTVHLWKGQSKKLGRRIDGVTVIFDMEGVGAKFLWKPGLDMYLSLVKILEDNYPEMLKRLCVINAPMIFPILWRMTKPMVSADMRKKIFVFGSNYRQQLLQFVDAEYLPAYLGGSMIDPDGNPRCVTKICQGGEIPKSYYLEESSGNEMLSVTINKGAYFSTEVKVEEPGAVLCWQFRTESHDIGFSVRLLNCEIEREIVANQRITCDLVTEDGSHVCTETGNYRVTFDNSYSWSRSKKLFYRIWIFEGSGSSLCCNNGHSGENGLNDILARFHEVTETKL